MHQDIEICATCHHAKPTPGANFGDGWNENCIKCLNIARGYGPAPQQSGLAKTQSSYWHGAAKELIRENMELKQQLEKAHKELAEWERWYDKQGNK